ncbi:MAG: 1-acyl-sn-glycerol-3-phosphate acyltransferase [candidate division KSB1 bacterium]|nr:1-acyl-sn-glycerol-3-phosphate acyltransferase [candidate division KSB1 bacterium]
MGQIISALLWLWGLLLLGLFGGTLVVATLLLPMKTYDRALKWMCRTLLKALGIRVKVEGLENIRPDRTYLFMSNHVNLFDVFVLGGHLPQLVRGVELEGHFRWFLYGLVIKRIGNIPISQKNPFSAMDSLCRAREALRRGISIVLMPEGHRTLDGNLRPFMRAPFDMARQAGVDVVPLAMVNALQINRKGSWLIRPGRMVLRIGKPLSSTMVRTMNVTALKETVRSHIALLLSGQESA